MALTFGDIGGCGCTGPTCTQIFAITGCNGLAYQGVTVSVLTSLGGTLLASGTTDTAGQVTLSWTGSAGTYYVTVTGASSRFVAYGQSLSLACSGTRTIALTVASGYHCDGAGTGCLLPLADTLHFTDSIIGAFTLTYGTRTFRILGGVPTNQTGWWGTVTYSYPNCGIAGCGCTGGPVTVDMFYFNSEVRIYTTSFAAPNTQCPCSVPAFCAPASWYNQSVSATSTPTCAPAFSFSGTGNEVNSSCLYCHTTSTITGTE